MDAAGNRIFHKDHFEPLVRGGTDDVENIVLACPPCNQRKNAMDGMDFRRKSLIEALDNVRTGLLSIHRALKRYKF
jgi:5-methylcytosine-specific restriction endonuclease McrA